MGFQNTCKKEYEMSRIDRKYLDCNKSMYSMRQNKDVFHIFHYSGKV